MKREMTLQEYIDAIYYGKKYYKNVENNKKWGTAICSFFYFLLYIIRRGIYIISIIFGIQYYKKKCYNNVIKKE